MPGHGRPGQARKGTPKSAARGRKIFFRLFSCAGRATVGPKRCARETEFGAQCAIFAPSVDDSIQARRVHARQRAARAGAPAFAQFLARGAGQRTQRGVLQL